eukprot:SAG11_NODE_1882_length_4128_cov_2.284438_6_plen_309_part_00
MFANRAKTLVKTSRASPLRVPEGTSASTTVAEGIRQPSTLGNETLRLKPYQVVGLNWLYLLHKEQLNGVLADEMGLGKTVQAIALLARMHMDDDHRPNMVVAPASVLDNWVREVKTWLPSAQVYKYHGSQEERAVLRDQLKRDQSAQYDAILVVPYSLFQGNSSDSKAERGWLAKLPMNYMVLDEGHAVKNAASARYRRLQRMQSDHKLLLTGTLIQNDSGELFAILHFLLPDLFNEESMEQANDNFSEDAVIRIRKLIEPFVLRRLKSEVLNQLLPKDDQTHHIGAGAASRRPRHPTRRQGRVQRPA